MLSTRYGWTPDQIRSMSEHDVDGYLEIIATRNKEDEIQRKKAGRKHKI